MKASFIHMQQIEETNVFSTEYNNYKFCTNLVNGP